MLLQYFIRSRDDMKSCEKQCSTHHRREQVGEFRPHPLALFIHPPLHYRCIILDEVSGRMSRFQSFHFHLCAHLYPNISSFPGCVWNEIRLAMLTFSFSKCLLSFPFSSLLFLHKKIYFTFLFSSSYAKNIFLPLIFSSFSISSFRLLRKNIFCVSG